MKLNNLFSPYWIAGCVLLSVVLLIQAVTFFVDESKGSYPIENARYYKGFQEKASIADALLLSEEQWIATQSLVFTQSDRHIWAKFSIPKALKNKDFIIRFNDPLIDYLQVYVVRDGKNGPEVQQHFEGGDSIHFSRRSFALANNTLSINANNQQTFIYVEGASKPLLNMNASVWTSTDFISFNDKYTVFFGLTYGYTLALVCYCIMMLTTAKRREYLWFFSYLVCFLLHIMSLSGHGFQYLWPNQTGLQSVMGSITISLTFTALTQFSASVINTKLIVYQRIFKLMVYTHLVIACIGLISLNTIINQISVIAVIVSVLVMPILCMLMNDVNKAVQTLCCLIWGILTSVTVFLLLAHFEWLSFSVDPLFILMIGFQLETILIGIALIYQYRLFYIETSVLKEAALRDRGKALQSKDEIVQLQNDSQNKLEQQVKAQTLQLQSALNDLNSASVELESMRNLDGLTSLPNRLAFEESLGKLVKQASELGKPLSIAVLDIDYFKRINDKYGHLAGDECLREFSHLIKQTFDIKEYSYCRFGGEEFMLASLLDPRAIKAKLDTFLKIVEQIKVQTGAGEITFTTSAGIASKYQVSPADMRSLMSMADNNLYVAKHKGRNLVVA